jgi:hypothetical protein
MDDQGKREDEKPTGEAGDAEHADPPPVSPHPPHAVHVHTTLHAGFKGGDIQKGREGWVE